MPGIQVAEAKAPRKSPKALAHLELHRKLDGGHIVKHVYHGFGHEPAEHHFNAKGKAKGGEHIVDHLMKHGGLPAYDRTESSETEEEFEA